MDRHDIIFLGRRDPYTKPTLEFVWSKIIGDGLVQRLFYDGSVQNLEAFLGAMMNEDALPFVMTNEDGKIVLFAWLNCIEGVMARMHFTMFRDSWGGKRNAVALGRKMVEHVLSRKDDAGYIIHTVVGITPVVNTLALRYVMALGMERVGIVPNGATLYYQGGRVVDAVLTVATRKSMGIGEAQCNA